jgi:hypothetical protein
VIDTKLTRIRYDETKDHLQRLMQDPMQVALRCMGGWVMEGNDPFDWVIDKMAVIFPEIKIFMDTWLTCHHVAIQCDSVGCCAW